MEKDALGKDREGKPVFLRDLWPAPEEIAKALAFASDPKNYRKRYSGGLEDDAGLWRGIESGGGGAL